MPRGDTTEHTDEQTRRAKHSGRGYGSRGVQGSEAERRQPQGVNLIGSSG
jgi:hypothetical protein